MAVVPVNAYAYASTFKLKDLLPLFDGTAKIEKDRLVANLGTDQWALAYDFGAVVFVGCDNKTIVDRLTQKLKEPNPPMSETFVIEVAPEHTTEVRFEKVVVPELTLGVVDIVAEVSAQSVAMDYYARDVDEIEAEIDRLTGILRVSGRMPVKVRDVTRFIGLCIATRNDIISTLALFDKPDATWESEQLDRLWGALRKMLELDDRYRALEAKLRMFQDSLVLLVDLARAARSFALEATIVILILIEIAMTVFKL